MKIYGFVGKSGTGKSYQAMNVCRSRGIESIIDDGLFIYHNAVMAGHSAKRDKNKMTAIKTAVFNDENDRKTVAEKILEVNPDNILILGTSVGMIEKICERLELHLPDEIIRIEDVADKDSINTALRQRREQGKHVIPVPTVQVKSQFSGYFMMPLRIFGRGRSHKSQASGEKSVVRPTYSYMGTFTISDKAVQQIVISSCLKDEQVVDVVHCNIENNDEGVKVNVGVILEYLPDLIEAAAKLQKFVDSELEMMTSFNIIEVDISIRALMPSRTFNEVHTRGLGKNKTVHRLRKAKFNERKR